MKKGNRMKTGIGTILTVLVLLLPLEAMAQSLAFTAEEQTAYDTHRASIEEPSEFLGEDVLAELQERYSVRPENVRKLRSLCRRMETHRYLHNFIPETARERYRIRQTIRERYMDTIAVLLIPDNPEMAGRYAGYAVNLAEKLGLPEETVHILTELAAGFSRRLREDPCASIARREMEALRTVLGREQTEKVADAANARMADSRIQAVWNALEKAGLSEQLDSVADCGHARTFYLKEAFLRDYYADDASLVSANLNDLYRHKPRMVTMYEGLRQQAALRKRHEEKVGGQFSW